MHEACQAAATQNDGVVRAARSVGFLPFLPQAGGVKGLRRATGPVREGHNEDSNRINPNILTKRAQ
eukprot:6939230-Alexandrium_andersonii.AAC.1